MKESIKEWLSMLVTPAFMITHYHTQWQGLLNVFGAITVLTSLFLIIFMAVIFFLSADHSLPKFPFPTLSKTRRIIGSAIAVSTAVYLLWTGHIIVASFYILATLLGYAALAMIWFYSQDE